MKRICYHENQWSEVDTLPGQNCQLRWLYVMYDEATWDTAICKEVGLQIHENHVKDTHENNHPAKYEVTEDYDFLMLNVFGDPAATETRWVPCSFFITENLLISIIPKQHWSVIYQLGERLKRNPEKAPKSAAGLLQTILSGIFHEQMPLKIALAERAEQWQLQLMNRKQNIDKWEEFFTLQRSLSRSSNNYEVQYDALSAWQNETTIIIDEHLAVRFKDLTQQLERTQQQLAHLHEDNRNLLQIYFSVVQERTNRTVKLLTIVSAIFLPLHLLAGLLGMNVGGLPLAQSAYRHR